jgi:uncharacterized protein RhaS with RHS repeats
MRDYDPTTGRYLQADPLGLVAGASVYGYALQNPGRYTDPRGEQSITRAGPMSTPGGGGMSMPTTGDYADAGREILEWSSKYNPLDLLIQGIVAMCTSEEDKACDDQLEVDVAICRQLTAPSRKRACYAQAHVRHAACLSGKSVPPFPYP